MGKIKTSLIKRTTRNLLKEENKFNEDFENNKKILGNTMPSKKVRNQIAGYLAKLKKHDKKYNSKETQ